MDQRKKRKSHFSQRNGRIKIAARQIDSNKPVVLDLCVCGLRQLGHATNLIFEFCAVMEVIAAIELSRRLAGATRNLPSACAAKVFARPWVNEPRETCPAPR